MSESVERLTRRPVLCLPFVAGDVTAIMAALLRRLRRGREDSMKKRQPLGASRDDPAAQQQAAEGLAVAALDFIAGEPDQLGRFLALTGIGPDSIRAAAREPNFLLGVLDHVAGDETLLLALAEHCGIDPEDVARARDILARTRPEVL
jgi:hypothetical protein